MDFLQVELRSEKSMQLLLLRYLLVLVFFHISSILILVSFS